MKRIIILGLIFSLLVVGCNKDKIEVYGNEGNVVGNNEEITFSTGWQVPIIPEQYLDEICANFSGHSRVNVRQLDKINITYIDNGTIHFCKQERVYVDEIITIKVSELTRLFVFTKSKCECTQRTNFFSECAEYKCKAGDYLIKMT